VVPPQIDDRARRHGSAQRELDLRDREQHVAVDRLDGSASGRLGRVRSRCAAGVRPEGVDARSERVELVTVQLVGAGHVER
jgi:hypothetical protein